MAVFSMTSAHIALNELNAAGFANSVTLSATGEPKIATTFGSGGYRQSVVGLGQFTASFSGFQDYATDGPSNLVGGPAGLGGLNTFSISMPGSTAGDIAHLGQCRHASVTELEGAVGDLASFQMALNGTGALVRGVMLHPAAARTSSSTGTAVAFTAPTATQALYAAFHVHSVTGTGTVTLTVQTDDNSGFTSSSTRITSSAFSAIGHQFSSLAGALTGETHVRLGWTISGFTSVTFSAAVGVR
jgi:hypothetical protein